MGRERTFTAVARDGDDYDVVHAPLLRHFPDLYRELGGDLAALLTDAAIPESAIDGAGEASYRALVLLLAGAAQRLDCPDFGMRLARRQSDAMFGPLGQAMRHSATFGEALAYVAAHNSAHSRAARVWTRALDPAEDAGLGDVGLGDAGGVFMGHDILVEAIADRVQAIEQVLLLGHLSALSLTGGHARARRVLFRHQPISPLRVYRQAFGCDVRFGANVDGIAFAAADLAAPLRESDRTAFAAVAAQIEREYGAARPPIEAEARAVLLRLLGQGDCGNADVAAVLGLHPRTLHRRLAAGGSSFQQVKDEVRRELLLYYLRQTALDFTRISERLGFAEQSVLTRKCRRWLGATPTQIRAGEIGQADSPIAA